MGDGLGFPQGGFVLPQALLELLALGDVLAGAEQPADPAVRADDDLPRRLYPAFLAIVAADDAVLAVEGLAAAKHMVARIRGRALPVLGVDHGQPALRIHDFIGRHTENLVVCRRAGQRVGGGVEGEMADARQALGLEQHGFVLGQGLA